MKYILNTQGTQAVSFRLS